MKKIMVLLLCICFVSSYSFAEDDTLSNEREKQADDIGAVDTSKMAHPKNRTMNGRHRKKNGKSRMIQRKKAKRAAMAARKKKKQAAEDHTTDSEIEKPMTDPDEDSID